MICILKTSWCVVKRKEVDLELYDVAGFATFTDFWAPPYLFQGFVEGLPQPEGKLAFVFNTYGALSGKTLRILERPVAAKGFSRMVRASSELS